MANANAAAAPAPEEEYLTPKQAARFLNVSRKTIYAWKRTGILDFYIIGRALIRIKKSDIIALLKPAANAPA